MKNYYLLLVLSFISTMLLSQSNDTITTASGLQYYYVQRGDGQEADSGSVVIAEYIGSFEDGSVFDSSRDRGQPFVFSLGKGQVIKGMDEGVDMMRIGDRMVFIMPSYLAYGEKGAGEVIPPNTTLIFDVELLDLKEYSLSSLLMDALSINPEDPSDTTMQVEAMFSLYDELAANDFEGIYRNESDLNLIGYTLLKDYPEEALEVFLLNVELYPEASNPYDSLAEAYMILGEKDLAIINYAKSLTHDPGNKNAAEMIQKLQAME